MPRRTKLIIVFVFVVLLAIPTIYVVRDWHPHQPLSFRLVHIDKGAAGEGSEGAREVRIRVTNSSQAHICLNGALMGENGGRFDFSKPAGAISPQMQDETAVRVHRGCVIIPPHSEVELAGLLIFPSVVPLAEEGRLEIHYYWHSQPMQWADQAIRWVIEHTSERVHETLYLSSLSLVPDIAPLETTTTTTTKD